MKHLIAAALVSCLLLPSTALAAGSRTMTAPAGALPPAVMVDLPSRSPLLSDAVLREAIRLASPADHAGRSGRQQSASPSEPNWVERHPVLFGALVGAGLGAASSIPRWNELYCATGGDEECLFHGASGVLFGAGAGAGIGAVVGWTVSR
jgi:hypothetical protein